MFIPTHPPPLSPLFPYTTLFRSLLRHHVLVALPAIDVAVDDERDLRVDLGDAVGEVHVGDDGARPAVAHDVRDLRRSEEHTSELQSRRDIVCRLLLEKKKNKQHT